MVRKFKLSKIGIEAKLHPRSNPERIGELVKEDEELITLRWEGTMSPHTYLKKFVEEVNYDG